MMSAAYWFSEDKEMLILSVIGFLVIREALIIAIDHHRRAYGCGGSTAMA